CSFYSLAKARHSRGGSAGDLASRLLLNRADEVHEVRLTMATITLEIPEELVIRLDPLSDRLAELLFPLFDSASAEKKLTLSGTAMTHPVFLELIDFLSTRPTAEQILTHKVSSAVQERLEELLDKNREEGLTTAEEEEMDAYRLVNHVMILLKARARSTV